MSTTFPTQQHDIDHESQRLLALRRFGVLDTAPEEIFDSITTAIAHICEVPMALISLVDGNRQWFKSAQGLDISETPREIAFCARAIEDQDNLTIVEDASKHEQFADNPLVTGDPGIRFYAGSPLVSFDGYAIGTLCVLDREARSITTRQQDALAALSKTVIAIMEERKQLQRVAVDRNAVEDLLQQQLERANNQADLHHKLSTHLLSVHDKPCAVSFGGTVRVNQAWQQAITLSETGYRNLECTTAELADYFQQAGPSLIKESEAFGGFVDRAFGSGEPENYHDVEFTLLPAGRLVVSRCDGAPDILVMTIEPE